MRIHQTYCISDLLISSLHYWIIRAAQYVNCLIFSQCTQIPCWSQQVCISFLCCSDSWKIRVILHLNIQYIDVNLSVILECGITHNSDLCFLVECYVCSFRFRNMLYFLNTACEYHCDNHHSKITQQLLCILTVRIEILAQVILQILCLTNYVKSFAFVLIWTAIDLNQHLMHLLDWKYHYSLLRAVFIFNTIWFWIKKKEETFR